MITEATYRDWYERSVSDPEGFWGEQADKFVSWFEPWDKVLSGGFDELDLKWFQDGKLNAAYNCLDRHLEKRGDQVAIIWEGDDASSQVITYRELHKRVCRFANALKQLGVQKGDRVCIYLPMIPEAAISMLACARIGAVHSVVFGGFSTQALQSRILDADCKIVITANEGVRGNKIIPLKVNVDAALKNCPNVKNVIVVRRTSNEVPCKATRDHWYHDLMEKADAHCEAAIMDVLDPLFILYTSGSTGKPKGILHGTGGYLVYAAITQQMVFDYQEGETYWCSADVGWVTGHTYGVYGPLLIGATTLMFEGIPTYPTPARFWEVIDKYKVNIFYTAPTAIRALRREGDKWVKNTSRKSLRILGTVGEPINAEAWRWYYDVVGDKRCPIVDTWWQTETGGIMITPLPGATTLKPSSAAWPFFGVVPDIVDDQGKSVQDEKMGKLIIRQPWPGMMLSIYKDHQRFVDTYFKTEEGERVNYYLTGDLAHKDADGYFWIAGRDDDVIKVSGHRLGSQEIENALVSHSSVAEAAVVGAHDEIKGHHVYAFVTLKADAKPSDTLKKELIKTVRASIGPIAVPDEIQWAESLPKTRSGKIMRRLLRKIADNDTKELGDLSTLADPQVVESLIKERATFL